MPAASSAFSTASTAAVGEDESPPFHRRLHTVRNKLLVLDYKEPLSVDSLDLVEHLFGDLITTSESFERLQQREDRLSHDLALAQAQIMPLRKTIARLTRENNQLHGKMIQQAEQEDNRDTVYKREIGNLRGQLDDLRFLMAQKDSKIADQSRRLEDLSTELNRTLLKVKVDQASVHQPSIDITATAPPPPPLPPKQGAGGSPGRARSPLRGEASTTLPSPDQPSSALVKALERKVMELQDRAEAFEEERDKATRALETREAEVNRLAELLEEDGAAGSKSKVAARAANAKIIENLNNQVDFLNSQLASREAQIQTLMGEEMACGKEARRVLQAQVTSLQEEKSRLLKRTIDLEDRLANALKAGKESSGSSLPVSAAGVAQAKAEEGGEEKEIATQGPSGGGRATTTSKTGPSKDQKEVAALQKALEQTKIDLTRKEALLQKAEQDLRGAMKEKDELQKETGSLTHQLNTLKSEKEQWRQRQKPTAEVPKKEAAKEMALLQSQVHTLERTIEDRENAIEKFFRQLTTLEEERDGLLKSSADAHSRVGELEARLESMRAQEVGIREQLEVLKNEVASKEQEAKRLAAALAEVHMSVTSAQDHRELDENEAIKLLKEAEAQKANLEKTLQHWVRVAENLGAEGSARQAALQSAGEEAVDLRAQLAEREQQIQNLMTTQQGLEEANRHLQETVDERTQALASRELVIEGHKKETERLRHELHRLQTLIEAMGKQSSEGEEKGWVIEEELATVTAELRTLQERQRFLSGELEAAKTNASVMESDRGALRIELERAMREAAREKDQHHEVLARLEVARTQLQQKDDQVNQIKSLFNQLHAGRDQLNNRLQKSYEELGHVEDREREALEKVRSMERRLDEKQEEIDRIRRTLEQLDEERDALQASLDHQQEVAAQVERERTSYDRSLRRLETDVEDERARAKASSTALIGKEREVRVLQGQITGLQHEAAETRKVLHSRLLELRAVNEDLQMMTRENQVANGDISRLARDREELKGKVQVALQRADKSEQLLRVCQIEKDDLLAAYRAVVDERKRLEVSTEELARARARLSQQLEENQIELGHLRTALLTTETELQRRAADASALERQVEALSRKLNSAQRRLENEEAEARRLHQDMSSQSKTVNNNATVLKHLEVKAAVTSEEAALAKARASSAERERDNLSRMLAEQRSHVTELERIIEAARAREAISAAEVTDLMRANLQLREALRRHGQIPPSTSPPSAYSPRPASSFESIGEEGVSLSPNRSTDVLPPPVITSPPVGHRPTGPTTSPPSSTSSSPFPSPGPEPRTSTTTTTFTTTRVRSNSNSSHSSKGSNRSSNAAKSVHSPSSSSSSLDPRGGLGLPADEGKRGEEGLDRYLSSEDSEEEGEGEEKKGLSPRVNYE